MNRRHMMASLLAAACLPQSALAQGFADQIVSQLREQGYTGISVSNTWLGRTRIVAQTADGSREIIVDPRTGEILRDLWQGRGSGSGIVTDRDRGRDDDDDDDDDDRDGDSSGSNSGSSGHGGGSGSGSGGDDDDDDDDD